MVENGTHIHAFVKALKFSSLKRINKTNKHEAESKSWFNLSQIDFSKSIFLRRSICSPIKYYFE